jgi:hypothetical protein
VNVKVASAIRGTAFVLALGARNGAAEGTTYVVDPARSMVAIHVGRAGLFKFAGHEHEVLAPRARVGRRRREGQERDCHRLQDRGRGQDTEMRGSWLG